MPDWLTHLLGQLSPEGIVGGTIVTIAAMVRTLGAIMEARTTRRFATKARSIPPSDGCAVSNGYDLGRENERLRGELHRLQWRVDELETQLTEVGRDHSHTARALNREREDCEMLRLRLGELKDLGRAHPRPSPSWVAVEDARPTPKVGMQIVRYEPKKTK